jgi:hypothetical protein
VSAILNKTLYTYFCPISNGFPHGSVPLYRRATRHDLIRAENCSEVDGGIFENVLHLANCTKFVTFTINSAIQTVPPVFRTESGGVTSKYESLYRVILGGDKGRIIG